MFKLQLSCMDNGWLDVDSQFLEQIPVDCDALAWVREQWPASDWRIALKKEEE